MRLAFDTEGKLENRPQFRIAHLLIGMSVVAVTIWLYQFWWQMGLLMCVTILPATALLWGMERLRRPPREHRIVRSSMWLTGLSLLFLVIYFLSVGPAIYLDVTYLTTNTGDSTPELMVKFYEPLEILNVPANPLHDAMDWYVQEWEEACGIVRAGQS